VSKNNPDFQVLAPSRQNRISIVKINIRPEHPFEYRQCEALVRDAFWDRYRPGCVEHLIVNQVRTSPELVLDLVAEAGGELLGCLIATRAQVISDHQEPQEMLYLGPLAVRPDSQGCGIGSQLLSFALARAEQDGFSGAFLYGDPAYYHRFGFQNADTWAVTTPDGLNFDAFMGIELRPGGLGEVSGRLIESAAFDVDPARLLEFDAGFPAREQHILPGQLPQ
jgi:predicted N-acetyltransferase YhbS